MPSFTLALAQILILILVLYILLTPLYFAPITPTPTLAASVIMRTTPTITPTPQPTTSPTLRPTSTGTPLPTRAPFPPTTTPTPQPKTSPTLRPTSTGTLEVSPLTPSPITFTPTLVSDRATDTPIPTDTPSLPPTDTPIPSTNTPIPIDTPTTEPTPQLLSSVNDYSLQPNGVAENVIELSMDTLGIGTLNLTYPITMSLNQSSLVRLIIRPSEELVSLPQVAVSPRATNEPDFTYSVTDQIQLYPLMTANLDGNGFDIISDNLSTKPVVPSQETVWDWSVTPRETGNQSLLLTISVPILMNDDWDVLQAQPLKSIPIDVSVEVTKTPMPTNTPKPVPTIQPTDTPTPTPTRTIPQQVVDNISNNATEFIGILLTFILGIPTAWILIARYRREVSKDGQKPTLNYDPNWTVKGVQEAVRKIRDVKILESWLLKENQRNNPRKEALKAIRYRLREIKKNKSE